MKAITVAACVLAGAASAAPTPTVEELVRRHVEARGGQARLDALRTLRWTGKMMWGGGEGMFVNDWARVQRRPSDVREEYTLQGLTAVVAFDGKDAWQTQPFGGRKTPERQTADDAKAEAHLADVDGPLVHWREKGSQVEALGTEDIDGTPALKLRVTRKDEDVVYVYLDPDYYLEIREVQHHFVRGAEQVDQTDFGSYAQVAGVWFPLSADYGAPNEPPGGHVVVDTLEANVDAPDALFHFPETPSAPRAIFSTATAPAVAAPPPLAQQAAVRWDSGVVSGLGARNIGSAAMSGRIAAVAGVVEKGRTTLYVGAASGGVWKSPDDGVTFKPVFDKQTVQSIGAIAIDPSDSKTVWVGTGEAWTRNSVSIGDGIYKSTDAGETWRNVGLPGSERISRIVVHPKDGRTVYACVPGKLWSDSKDRGLYKTTDGGGTWSLVLPGPNPSTGCAGLAMDPQDPNVLYAGLWDFRRKGWTFRSGGDGPDKPSGSGLYRSADGGKTWSKIETGLPAKPWGRVEVALAPSNPRIVYALIESKDSALYRSDDGGTTWQARDKSQQMVWRPFYFGRLVVDPLNPDRVFKAAGGLIASDDGGRSFTYAGGRGHGDWHDIRIDPTQTQHVVAGDDGGLWISRDGGNRWAKTNNLPVSQFYHVALDARDPYQVYGGLQDNSSWVGDSSYPGGVANSRWENLYNSDGFWVFPDPTDPDAVYAESQGGDLSRIDRRTHAVRDIQPKAGLHERLRFNWNSPIALSPTQPKTLYLGSQFLFRSRDQGESWERISPDLSTNDPEKQKQEKSGGITVDNSSAEEHTTIYSISESPKDTQTIWVGTDDGNLQLTRDGGKHWTNVVGHVKGLPPASWVSWVEASRFDPATAYAAFDRHTFGDMTPWVFRTTDFGQTWNRIAAPGQGVRGYAHVIREDAVKPDLLFLGTELGLWVSVDAGKTWAEFKGGGFPSVAVRDLQVHSRDGDLVLATHGRGIWIVDDLTPLRVLTPTTLAGVVAFLPGRAVQQRMPAEGGWVEGDAAFVGASAAGGATLTYYQRTRHLFGPFRVEVLDPSGKVLDTLPASKRRGINRIYWPMQVKPPRVPSAAQVAFSGSRGPRVPPGSYTVRLTRGDQVLQTSLDIGVDRRAPYSAADRKAEFDASMRVHALFGDMSDVVDRINALKTAADAKTAALGDTAAAGAAVHALAAHLDDAKRKIVATTEGGAITGELRIREHTDILYGVLLGWEGRPAPYQLERIDVLRRELDEVKATVDSIVASELPKVNAQLRAAGKDPIDPATITTSAPHAERLQACLASDWENCRSALDAPRPAEND